MQIIQQTDTRFLLRFDRGEEVLAALAQFATEHQINAAVFHGIGAAEKVVLSYYHLPTKTYEDHSIDEEVEITNLSGNIAWMNEKPIIHAHGTVAKRDLSVVGGHYKQLEVSATCEVCLETLPERAKRAFDEETGLNLLSEQ